jgi:sigma-B regulation protein RsbU (phosphoserine phosphatase)
MPARILVVDDEPDLQALIKQQFRKKVRDNEFQFSFAQNGVDALEKLQQNGEPDLVLTDINMPEMDGLTLLNEISGRYPLLKSVVVSAYGDMTNIRTAMNRGAFDFVTKPIDFQDLEITINKTVQEMLALKQAEKARAQLLAIQQELNIAHQIQQSILPRDFSPFPERTDFALHATMLPAREVGGDFYDFFPIDAERLGVVIGDVSGKGVPAAIFMAMTRSMLKTTAMKGLSPGECLHDVNVSLCHDNVRCMFVSVFYGVLNLRTKELEYCNGGHNLPCLLHQNGKVETLPKVGGIILGVMKEEQYSTEKITLAPGDALFLYTDGVNEAMDSAENQFSDARLNEVLQKLHVAAPAELIHGVVESVRAFCGEAPQTDDITTLALKLS